MGFKSNYKVDCEKFKRLKILQLNFKLNKTFFI